MEDSDRTDPERPVSTGDGSVDDLPFPESGYSPALQRTLKKKFDRGDIGGMDKQKFLKQLGRTAGPREKES